MKRRVDVIEIRKFSLVRREPLKYVAREGGNSEGRNVGKSGKVTGGQRAGSQAGPVTELIPQISPFAVSLKNWVPASRMELPLLHVPRVQYHFPCLRYM